MTWSDVEAASAVVFLNGVRQSYVLEAHPGVVGHVRKYLRVGGSFVIGFGGHGLIEVVEYGIVEIHERAK